MMLPARARGSGMLPLCLTSAQICRWPKVPHQLLTQWRGLLCLHAQALVSCLCIDRLFVAAWSLKIRHDLQNASEFHPRRSALTAQCREWLLR
jgi:hypothetical protein